MGLKFLATIFIATLMSAHAHATEISLVRQVILRDKTGLVLQPNVIVRAGNDDFVVAGSIPGAQEAWATKIDAQGKPIWRYVTGVRDSGLAPGDVPEFRGAAVMKDGSTFLCGYMPTPAGKYLPALLTHLDAAGHTINESLLKPSNSAEHGLSYLDDCVPWKNGVAMLGHVIHFVGGQTRNLYWTLALDQRGHLLWETLLPTQLDNLDSVGPWQVGPLMVYSDFGLLFAGGNSSTEVFWVSETGDLIAKTKFSGAFRLFRNLDVPRVPEMYGSVSSGLLKTVALDNNLTITHTSQANKMLKFDPYIAYQMPNKSIVMFGSSRAGYAKQLGMYIDSTLQSAQAIDLHHHGYADTAFISAAAPTGRDGEYVTARPLMKEDFSGTNLEAIGAILDFIKVQ
jgi:hypothetical protein